MMMGLMVLIGVIVVMVFQEQNLRQVGSYYIHMDRI